MDHPIREAYHGTSSNLLDDIRKNGLNNPYLAKTRELAQYYAKEAVDEHGGEPVVLRVSVPESSLRYDRASMDEPVKADQQSRNAAWNKSASEHPEWEEAGRVYHGRRLEYSWGVVGL